MRVFSFNLGAPTSSGSTALGTNYFNGYQGGSGSWSVAATGYTQLVNAGGNTLTTVYNSGQSFLVTAQGNSLLGIVFTPQSATSAYLIKAAVAFTNSSATDDARLRLWDGGTPFAWATMNQSPTSATVVVTGPLEGVYAGGTTTPITISLQACSSAGTVSINGSGSFPATQPLVHWSIFQIA